MKNLHSIIFFLAYFGIANAQSFQPTVIGSAGTFATSAGGTMSWTIGELMTETYSSGTNFFSQGFHQPDTNALVAVTNLSAENISIYPNPVTDNLYIDFSKVNGNFSVEVFDVLGNKTIEEKEVTATGTLHRVSFSSQAEGIYILNLVNTETHNRQSYKINKLK